MARRAEDQVEQIPRNGHQQPCPAVEREAVPDVAPSLRDGAQEAAAERQAEQSSIQEALGNLPVAAAQLLGAVQALEFAEEKLDFPARGVNGGGVLWLE